MTISIADELNGLIFTDVTGGWASILWAVAGVPGAGAHKKRSRRSGDALDGFGEDGETEGATEPRGRRIKSISLSAKTRFIL
jgi:hypothetical protein